jgi:hypothetical protein
MLATLYSNRAHGALLHAANATICGYATCRIFHWCGLRPAIIFDSIIRR